jgi:two-component system invasion response regulator UvrY
MHISVVAVSHQMLLLEALQSAVVGTEFQIMSSAFKGRLGLDEFAVNPPRCLILDGGCPKQSPLVMVDRAKRILPDTLILVYLRSIRAVECQSLLSLGVSGLMDASCASEDVVVALRKIKRQEVHLAPKVAQALALSRFRSANPFEKLSPRELTVCDLVFEGSRAPDIAQQLSVSAKTINTYRYRIFEKLGIASDVELTHLAYNHGMKGVESSHGRV